MESATTHATLERNAKDSASRRAPLGIIAALNLVLEPSLGARQIASGAGPLGSLLAIGVIRFADSLVLFHPSFAPIKLIATFLMGLVPPMLVATTSTGLLMLMFAFGETRVRAERAFTLVVSAIMWGTLLGTALGWVGALVIPDYVIQHGVHRSMTNLGFLVDPVQNPLLNFLFASADVVTAAEFFLVIRALPHLGDGITTHQAAKAVLMPWALVSAIALCVKLYVS
jgi:hypothetical protein